MTKGRKSGQVSLWAPPQSQAGQYRPPFPPVRPTAPGPQVGLVNIHDRVEEADRNAYGTKVRPDMRPTPRSRRPSNKEVCMRQSYQAD